MVFRTQGVKAALWVAVSHLMEIIALAFFCMCTRVSVMDISYKYEADPRVLGLHGWQSGDFCKTHSGTCGGEIVDG